MRLITVIYNACEGVNDDFENAETLYHGYNFLAANTEAAIKKYEDLEHKNAPINGN